MSRISIIIKCCKYKAVCWHGRSSRIMITQVAWVCFRRKTVQSPALNHWGSEEKTIHSSGTAMLQSFRSCGGFQDWILLAASISHLWQHITPLAGPTAPHSCPAVPWGSARHCVLGTGATEMLLQQFYGELKETKGAWKETNSMFAVCFAHRHEQTSQAGVSSILGVMITAGLRTHISKGQPFWAMLMLSSGTQRKAESHSMDAVGVSNAIANSKPTCETPVSPEVNRVSKCMASWSCSWLYMGERLQCWCTGGVKQRMNLFGGGLENGTCYLHIKYWYLHSLIFLMPNWVQFYWVLGWLCVNHLLLEIVV